MAKKTKKISFMSVVCTLILSLVAGAVIGVAGNIFLFVETYIIPPKEIVTKSVAAGSMQVDVVKNQELSIHFIELGNKYTGDCTLIKVGDVEILIDAGSRTSSIQSIYEYVNQYVDGNLDYVIVTHAHQDHYAGFATSENTDSLFDLFTVDTIIQFSNTNQTTGKMYNNFLTQVNQTVAENNTEVFTALECYNNKNGAQRSFDLSSSVSLNILYQEYYETKAHSENDYSVCCMINQQNENYYLFTGDLEEDGEASLVEYYKQDYGVNAQPVKLYKAGHHGSKTSSSEELLTFFKPEVVCVCCCAGSSEYTSNTANQFPTQEFINRVAEFAETDKIYVTTLCLDYNKGSYTSFNGNIVVYSNASKEVFVACANNNTILKDTEWFKANRVCPTQWQT